MMVYDLAENGSIREEEPSSRVSTQWRDEVQLVRGGGR
jgi:hypothetical protein